MFDWILIFFGITFGTIATESMPVNIYTTEVLLTQSFDNLANKSSQFGTMKDLGDIKGVIHSTGSGKTDQK